MKTQFYADHFVNSLEDIFNLVSRLVSICWIIGLFYLFCHNWEIIPQNWLKMADQFLMNFYEKYKPGSVKFIAVIFAPFYIHLLFAGIVYMVKQIRKSIFSKIAFECTAQANIVDKKEKHGGTSERDWVNYYLYVEHPVSRYAIKFEVDEEIYLSYNNEDSIDVRYNEEQNSILYLSASVNTEKVEQITKAMRSKVTLVVLGRRIF
ncbi:MAG: hypothetical protein RLZZ292_1688 [Bacteroidota bacterium]|jgi:hypothetical protein